MPLNRNETLLDEVLFKDGCISWQDNTTRTLLHPVTKSTDVPSSIDSLKHEGGVNTLLSIIQNLSPVLSLPPTTIRSMEPTI